MLLESALEEEYTEDIPQLLEMLGNKPFRVKSSKALLALSPAAWDTLSEKVGFGVVGLLQKQATGQGLPASEFRLTTHTALEVELRFSVGFLNQFMSSLS
jgi:hypothetical protein